MFKLQDVLDEEVMIEKATYNTLMVDELKQYIAAGKDVNYQSGRGRTALMWTAYHGQTELTQMLLDAIADVNMQNNDGDTALHHAALKNNPSLIAQLIKAGADVNMQDNNGWTALHEALNNSNGHMACTLLLSDAEANLWLDNKYGKTPICYGLQEQHSNDDMMRLLLEHGTCKDTGFTALMEASRRRHVPAVKKLLALGANVHEKDKYGTTALDVASSDECAMLLSQHTMMSAPLPPPPESPEQDVLDEEVMVDKAQDNKLVVDELKQYIAAGKDVNYQDEKAGRTALMWTAYNDQTELTQMLLDANADVNMQDNYGQAALHMVFNADMTCTLLLLDAKANSWLRNGYGATPMDHGLQRQHSNNDMMRLLLEHGTCKDTGFTALMEAARQDYMPAVKKLLALGANVYEKDKYGTTALDVTSSDECAMLLRQHTMMSAPLPPPPELPEQDVPDEKTTRHGMGQRIDG